MTESSAPTPAIIEAIWRIEAARLLGGLVRFVRDVERAEDLAQEALLSALERWPEQGIPDNPGAWLMTAAKHRAIDEMRRHNMMRAKQSDLEYVAADWLSASVQGVREESLDEPVGDDVLRMMLIACHPVLSKEARVALTLRLVAGLSTGEIARAFLTTESTLAQRIVRAKRTLSEAKVPFEVPRGEELKARVPPTLEVIYLIFNEGYAATSGDAWVKQDLCEEAMRLGRVLSGLLPENAEVLGLLALMELQASRARARVGPNGTPVLLFEQDRRKWDRLLITRGLAALERAQALAQPLGPYTLQAAIAACHARALTPEHTEWARIVALYDALVALTGSPVVELNRAVAVGFAYGAAAALLLLDELAQDAALAGYHLLPAARADFLLKLGRNDEARREFERASGMTQNSKEQALLRKRAASCDGRKDG